MDFSNHSQSQAQPEGVIWQETTFGLEPKWAKEPDQRAIRATISSLYPSSASPEVSFLAQGAFNKIYNVRVNDEDLIMRVSLPVDRAYKILSEVATLKWINAVTSVPAPEVIAYNDSQGKDAVGFEWILTTKLPGKPFSDRCRSVPLDAKIRLVKQLAAHSAALFQHQLRSIGNLYSKKTSDHVDSPFLGRIVSMHFFWGERVHMNVFRGPFRWSRHWMRARLDIIEGECKATLAKYSGGNDIQSDAEDEIDDATRTLRIVNSLNKVLSLVFPEPPSDGDTEIDEVDGEPTMIFHDDLSQSNILIDERDELCGLIDWECVSALPLWKACDLPSFLDHTPRETEPYASRYTREESGELADLYWEHMWEYEATVLRRVFLDEMGSIERRWIDIFNSSQRKRDIDLAVTLCDSEFSARPIEAWIMDVLAGKPDPPSLRTRIDSD